MFTHKQLGPTSMFSQVRGINNPYNGKIMYSTGTQFKYYDIATDTEIYSIAMSGTLKGFNAKYNLVLSLNGSNIILYTFDVSAGVLNYYDTISGYNERYFFNSLNLDYIYLNGHLKTALSFYHIPSKTIVTPYSDPSVFLGFNSDMSRVFYESAQNFNVRSVDFTAGTNLDVSTTSMGSIYSGWTWYSGANSNNAYATSGVSKGKLYIRNVANKIYRIISINESNEPVFLDFAGGTDFDVVSEVLFDYEGNFYVIGFDVNINPKISKYNSTGNHIWTNDNFSQQAEPFISGLIDNDSKILVSGLTMKTKIFDCEDGTELSSSSLLLPTAESIIVSNAYLYEG